MPIKVFTYYSYALLLYIEKSNISDFKAEKYADEVDTAADCLFNEFSERASSNPIEIRNIFPDFYPLMSKIAKNQNAYGLDEDIYGDFQEKLEYIESKLNEINN